MRIGQLDIDERVVIIAEVGNNHEGNFARALDLVAAAAGAGADVVKFQTIVPERLVASSEIARIAQLRRYAFTPDQFAELAKAAEKAGVMFMSTPFDLESVAMLDPLVPAFKIASGDNDWAALLRAVAATKKPVIVSTGLAALADVAEAKAVFDVEWKRLGVTPGLAILHCVSAYPTAPEHANLGALRALATLGASIGYSDHTLGIEAAILSVALGARIIEKHFTLDRNQSDFRDHKLSSDPAELAALVAGVRRAEELIGNGEKAQLECEAGVAAVARRSVHVARSLVPGEVIAESDLICLRPAGGIRAAEMDLLVGRRVARPVAAGARLETADLD